MTPPARSVPPPEREASVSLALIATLLVATVLSLYLFTQVLRVGSSAPAVMGAPPHASAPR